MPKNVEGALAINKSSGNHYWQDANMEKEMSNKRLVFKILIGNETVLIGYTMIKCHIIFEIKFNFTRKARFVAGAHLTNAFASLTHSTVVSRARECQDCISH